MNSLDCGASSSGHLERNGKAGLRGRGRSTSSRSVAATGERRIVRVEAGRDQDAVIQAGEAFRPVRQAALSQHLDEIPSGISAMASQLNAG